MPDLCPAALSAQPDAMLARAASRGDDRAFEFLVARYHAPLLVYCRQRLRNAARAEDVVQQTLISAWVGLSSGAEIENVRAWLFRICRNATIDATRRRGSDWQEIRGSLPALGAEDELGRRREARELLVAIADLPRRQREALLRTAIDGHSHERVAEALGLSEGAVRGLVYRARATLRAAATALTPPPVLDWLTAGGRARAPLARVAEILAGDRGGWRRRRRLEGGRGRRERRGAGHRRRAGPRRAGAHRERECLVRTAGEATSTAGVA